VSRTDTLGDQDEYLRGGLAGLTCERCGVEVLVKKNSPQHTSIQWSTDAVRGCAEFAAAIAGGGRTALIVGCGSLQTSIDHAAHQGRLDVP